MTDTETGTNVESTADAVPRSARWLVGIVLLALVVPGVIGFELWPLSGWRLFSASRDEAQTVWELDAVDAQGESQVVSLEDLPLAYRTAEWPLNELPGASETRRDDVCQALLGAVADVRPDTVELQLNRDHQELVERDGDWTLTHDREPFHSCHREDRRYEAMRSGPRTALPRNWWVRQP